MDNSINQKSSRRILKFYSNHIKLSELGRFTKQMNSAVASCNIWTCCHCSLSPYSRLSIPPMSSVMVNCHDLATIWVLCTFSLNKPDTELEMLWNITDSIKYTQHRLVRLGHGPGQSQTCLRLVTEQNQA